MPARSKKSGCSMKKTCGPGPGGVRYSQARSVCPLSVTASGCPVRSSDGVVSRTIWYSGMITVVGRPTAAWHVARPLTASPSPPVRANGQYSAVRWVTPIRSAGAIWGRGAAAVAARRGWAGLRRRDFGAGVVAPMLASTGSLSGRRRIVRRLLTPHRGEIVLGDVFPHHALRGESGARRAQRVSHLLDPTVRDALGITAVEQRHLLGFEQAIQLLGVGRIGVLTRRRRGDGPAVRPIVTLGPPPVQRAHLRHAVQGRFHAAGAARLERRARHVEPEV